ncbi:site-specific integrase [Schlegelella koreensis]|uniref:Site-specific integrase n=1 Tax=Piscinibacter koreensis TaxID=2742824 RepID=A0A7Y6TY19_9BURK|nr:site-specific integrase [Schlegelella koreensis]
MARIQAAAKLHQLTTREVLAAGDGDLTDGGGLLLRVRDASASWVFRFTAASGRRPEMGLGAAHRGSAKQAGESLTTARSQAHAARELLRQGIDPIDERDGRREAARRAVEEAKAEQQRQHLTLARAARGYHERVIEPTRTTKHAAQWIASLEHHVPEALWHAPIASIEAPALLAGLSTVRSLADPRERVPETLQRVRQRLDSVFEDAIFHGHCTTNPAAAIRRKMREAMPRGDAGQLKALPYREAPALMERLRQAEGIAARCLEFAVLTASRTSEALLATWAEFDLNGALWVIPKDRMKAKEEHTVHLSPAALAVLQGQRGLDPRYVFPSPMLADRPMSNMAMLTVLDRLGMRDRTTVHGLCRATFSTWANETGAARPDVIEACLAHEEKNRVRAAYNRAQFNEERRALLEAWAGFLAQPYASNIVPLRAA